MYARAQIISICNAERIIKIIKVTANATKAQFFDSQFYELDALSTFYKIVQQHNLGMWQIQFHTCLQIFGNTNCEI